MKKSLTLTYFLLLTLFLVACSSTSRLTSSSSSSSQETGTVTTTEASSDTIVIDENKDNYKIPDYNQWNHEELSDGTKVKVSGEIVQTIYEDSAVGIRLAVDGNYDTIVYAVINEDYYQETVSEGDIVTLYGYSFGRISYESTLKATITIPYMEVSMYEPYRSKTYSSKVLYDNLGIKLEQTNFDTLKLSNNGDLTIQASFETVAVDGQVISSYGLSDLSYADLSKGQWVEDTLEDYDGVMKAGKTLSIEMKIMDSAFNTLATIPVEIVLEKDIIN